MDFLQNLSGTCRESGCKFVDVQPVRCILCFQIYCMGHSSPFAHNCSKKIGGKIVNFTGQKREGGFKCVVPECPISTVVPMKCPKCNLNFCGGHIVHDCDDILTRRDVHLWKSFKNIFQVVRSSSGSKASPKSSFSGSKVDMKPKPVNKPGFPSPRAMENKLRLLKIKGKAVGDFRVSVFDRVFFAVDYPYEANETRETKHFFVSKSWTLGYSIDFFAKRMKLNNNNNLVGASKLLLFLKESGGLISKHMVKRIDTLMKAEALIDGDHLVLEYVPPELIESGYEFKIIPDRYD